MLRNLPDRSRSLLATLVGRSAGLKRRRPSRSKRPPIGTEQLESRAMLAGVDINGGLSWNGWTNRGLSNQGGLYGSGGTTGRDTYEVYTTTFAFAGNAISGQPVQAVAPAPDGFDSGRLAWIPGGRQIQVSAGAFQAGNTILGIGVRATASDGSIAGFWPTIRFDLDNDSYQPASFEKDSAGRTIKLNSDGRTSFTSYAEPGDFTVQFEGSASWRGSSINVREAATAQLPAATVQLPGGVGSGTSYDFAFRAFAQPAAKSYQMFIDMTAIPSLYGSVYRTFFPARTGVGTIGDRVTVSLNGLGSNNVVFDANLTLPSVDLDVDSNNDGTIDPDNGPAGTDDRIEEPSPGQIIFANTDDDDRNGVADALDAGPIAAENDLAPVLLAVAPAASFASIVVTYDESVVRLYAHPDRRGPIASGVVTATGGRFYAEGRSAGTTLVTAAFPNAGPVTDTVRLTVQPYPGTIDVDIDSDNNNGFLRPARSEWEDILEDHEYGIGKLIMLDNPNRPLTPIVMELPTGLPKNAPTVGVRVDWNATGVAGQVQLWNRVLADGVRNPAPVSEGGDQILAGIFCRLSDLNYNPTTGTITIWAEGIRENARLKTLAGVEASPRVDERIRGTLVVNGDDAAFDEVKYIVANEDSFYHALHTRQEVRNALASRGVYSFAPMPKFSLQPKSPKDLDLGDGDEFPLSPNVPGFKAMVYQDYITGDRQYVLAFGGTDDKTFTDGDWVNNVKQAIGRQALQYTEAMKIADDLADDSNIPKGQLVVTGHSLGGGLASAAAVVAGAPADTFNASWLNPGTLLTSADNGTPFRVVSIDPLLFGYEIYPGALTNLANAQKTIDAYFVDYDILTRVQQVAFVGLDWVLIAPVGSMTKLDSPYDVDMAVAGLPSFGTVAADIMFTCHKMNVVLYGLLVKEDTPTLDMLGYSLDYLRRLQAAPGQWL